MSLGVSRSPKSSGCGQTEGSGQQERGKELGNREPSASVITRDPVTFVISVTRILRVHNLNHHGMIQFLNTQGIQLMVYRKPR
jgi:hypothetical protein